MKNKNSDISPVQSTLLEKLRQSTNSVHAALEQHSYSQQLMHGTVHRTKIVSHIKAEHIIYTALEAHMLQHTNPNVCALWKHCLPRTAQLHHDLTLLQSRYSEPIVPEAEQQARHFAERIQSMPTDSMEVLGLLYVTEGSHLGGAVIAKRLAQAFPEDADALSRFHIYPQGIGRVWKSFCTQMNALTLTATQEENILTTAHQTFAGFEKLIASLSTPLL